jgi:multisubunit Na+/H+ antiporter MnhG subunit
MSRWHLSTRKTGGGTEMMVVGFGLLTASRAKKGRTSKAVKFCRLACTAFLCACVGRVAANKANVRSASLRLRVEA